MEDQINEKTNLYNSRQKNLEEEQKQKMEYTDNFLKLQQEYQE